MGLLISLMYIGVVLGVATILSKNVKNARELTRKWIHIMVGNWVFIAFSYFTNVYWLALVPLIFIGVNAFSHKYALIEAMERHDSDGLGTVYYPISLLIVCVFSFLLKMPHVAIASVLSLSLGDGFAALIGKSWGHVRIPNKHHKTDMGSITLFVITFMILICTNYIVYQSAHLVYALLIAAFTTAVEFISTDGFDNLTVPLSVALLYALLQRPMPWVGAIIIMTLLISYVAWMKDSLSLDGVLMAFIVGILLYVLGGFVVWLSMIIFFVGGSVASGIMNETKAKAKEKEARTGARTWVQVLANTLPVVSILLLGLFVPLDPTFIVFVSCSVFAAAAADTLSSEIGMLSQKPAQSFLSRQTVDTGLSGGITRLGLLGGLMGSVLIAFTTLWTIPFRFTCAIIVLGFFGTLLDSILGATIQVKYQTEDGAISEIETKGAKISGIAWMDNSMVNVLTISIVATCAALVFVVLG